MAVVGFAAFSPGAPALTESTASTTSTTAMSDVSARVASAVLALRVTEADSRVATTVNLDPATTTPDSARSGSDTTTTTAQTTTTTDVADEPVSVESSDATVAAASATTTAGAATTKAGDTTPPPIKVTSHDDGDTVTSRVVTFEGTSEAGATVASGPYAATMSDNGNWTIKLAVIDGANGAKFTATDKAGNAASTHIVVNYDEPSSSPTTTKAASTTTTTQATNTTQATATTTTSGSTSSKWSPNWPADSGGSRDVEAWRSTAEKYWPSSRVDCVLGIIKRESNGDPQAYNSSSSAEGLMQHLSKYWVSRAKGAGFVDGNGLVATPFNGAANIAAGAYLANYYDGAIGEWWNPWKSGGGTFTANYGSCTSSNPG